MTSLHPHGVSPEFPFASQLRSSDRERILVQLMTSAWITHAREPEAEVREGLGEMQPLR
jgi:hypothetical protein